MTDKPIHPNLPPHLWRQLKPGLRFGQAVYSAAQMHDYANEYAAVAIAAERERCAKLCDEARAAVWPYHDAEVFKVAQTVCENLANRIRGVEA